jgi:predicted secreted Zn-dependent protease
MADMKKMALAGGAGLALLVLKRTPLRRVGTAIIVTRTVWKDPRVQKVRQHVQKRVEKEIQKKAAKK